MNSTMKLPDLFRQTVLGVFFWSEIWLCSIEQDGHLAYIYMKYQPFKSILP